MELDFFKVNIDFHGKKGQLMNVVLNVTEDIEGASGRRTDAVKSRYQRYIQDQLSKIPFDKHSFVSMSFNNDEYRKVICIKNHDIIGFTVTVDIDHKARRENRDNSNQYIDIKIVLKNGTEFKYVEIDGDMCSQKEEEIVSELRRKYLNMIRDNSDIHGNTSIQLNYRTVVFKEKDFSHIIITVND